MTAPLRDCVYDHSGATGSVRLLLVTLANWTDPQHGYANPKIKTLCRAMGIDRRNVRRAIERAEKERLLTVQRGTGRDHPSHYYVLCGNLGLHQRGVTAPPIAERKRGAYDAERGVTGPPKGGDAVLTNPRLGLKVIEGVERRSDDHQNGVLLDAASRAAAVAAAQSLLDHPDTPPLVRRVAEDTINRYGGETTS